MLWEAITGARFAGDKQATQIARLHARLTGTELPLRTVGSHVPEALAQIVDRAIAFDPAHRFPDAASFADAVDALPGQPARTTRNGKEPLDAPGEAVRGRASDDAQADRAADRCRSAWCRECGHHGRATAADDAATPAARRVSTLATSTNAQAPDAPRRGTDSQEARSTSCHSGGEGPRSRLGPWQRLPSARSAGSRSERPTVPVQASAQPVTGPPAPQPVPSDPSDTPPSVPRRATSWPTRCSWISACPRPTPRSLSMAAAIPTPFSASFPVAVRSDAWRPASLAFARSTS